MPGRQNNFHLIRPVNCSIFAKDNYFTRMANIRRLAGDTVWYGLSSIVGRVINILLLPVITSVLPVTQFGGYSTLYSMVGILFVFYTLRLETAYFRFGSEEGKEQTTYSSALTMVYGISIFLSVTLFLLPGPIISLLNLSDDYRIYIPMLAVILFFDAINEIPFCQLRLSNRPRRFAFIKIGMILTNVIVVCFFFLLCPWLLDQGAIWISAIYQPQHHLTYLIGANVISSGIAFLFLLPQWTSFWKSFDLVLIRQMMAYSMPLLIVGLAGIANETLDRVFLQNLLPFDMQETLRQVGIYSGNYKIAMFIALFTQAFRYAAEPFFFQQYRKKDSNILYGKIATYYTVVSAFGFLAVTLTLPWLQQIFLKNPSYVEGYSVTVIILMANILLGLYYNLSIWYKLLDKTWYGLWISLVGVSVTILGNLIFIPMIGYMASAWTTLACYLLMTILCYSLGSRFYEFKIEWRKIGLIILITVGSYVAYEWFWHGKSWDAGWAMWMRFLFFLTPLGIYYLSDKAEIHKVLQGRI